MPFSNNPNSYPNWFPDNQTGEYTGFYIEYLQELFKAMNMNYTLLKEYKTDTYSGLGNFGGLFMNSQMNFSFKLTLLQMMNVTFFLETSR